MVVKQFDITMTDGNVQTVVADYYSYDTAQYIFWKHNDQWEVVEVYRVPMMYVRRIESEIVEV